MSEQIPHPPRVHASRQEADEEAQKVIGLRCGAVAAQTRPAQAARGNMNFFIFIASRLTGTKVGICSSPQSLEPLPDLTASADLSEALLRSALAWWRRAEASGSRNQSLSVDMILDGNGLSSSCYSSWRHQGLGGWRRVGRASLIHELFLHLPVQSTPFRGWRPTCGCGQIYKRCCFSIFSFHGHTVFSVIRFVK